MPFKKGEIANPDGRHRSNWRKHFDAAIAADTAKHKTSIFEFAPNSNGARDYFALSEEVISRTCPEFTLVNEKEEAEVEDLMQDHIFS